jgi:hypothetical protein
MLYLHRMYPTINFVKLVIIVSMLSCNEPPGKLIAIQSLPGYPSGSGLVYHSGHIYLMGDDATYMLVTDTMFNAVDSIPVFASAEKRISKDKKPDIEAMALISKNKNPLIVMLGSGSLSPNRDSCIIIDPVTKEKKYYNLAIFYGRLKAAGIRDLNIEGVTALQGGIALVSRGNKSFPKNHLIITSDEFWENQETAIFKLIKAGANGDTSFFNGVSGMDYSHRTDQLLLTVSTEDTHNSYDDGAIGKSYLWIINNISSKKELEGINPNRIIDLEEIDSRFKGQKIESVCIVAESKKEKELVLVSDDDKGGSALFRLVLNVNW